MKQSCVATFRKQYMSWHNNMDKFTSNTQECSGTIITCPTCTNYHEERSRPGLSAEQPVWWHQAASSGRAAAPLPSAPNPGCPAPYLHWLSLHGMGATGRARLHLEVPTPCKMSQSERGPGCRVSDERH